MAKYLFCASYTAEGAKGLLKEGGSSRCATIEEMIGGLGGTMECMYYAFGDTDVYLIADLPDAASAAALSLTVGSSGAASVKTVALVPTEDIDAAGKKSVAYRAPGR
jgi:uncharacterized protein with GYD domain